MTPTMRLADFILANREPILVEWESFARTCAPAGDTMGVAALRDHANEMLSAIAADLATAQGPVAQTAKSRGHAPQPSRQSTTAAAEHGAGRAESGFTVEQMVAEYRALRASVLRLWTRSVGVLTGAQVEDLTRFNEAIDQALAESVTRFDEEAEHAKETFLAILGHDLRTPLAAMLTSATFMLDTGELEEPHRTLVARIAGSARRTTDMVGELLDFTRSRLGGGIPIVRAPMNLGKVVHDAVDEITAARPGCRIRIDARGRQRGRWDAARLSQALGNLIGNAVEHGGAGGTVSVEVRGDEDRVAVVVHNDGEIAADRLDGIFNPMKGAHAGSPPATGAATAGLGLGLYIAERIVSAHGGRIVVESSAADGTTFTVYLPRDDERAHAAAMTRVTPRPPPAG